MKGINMEEINCDCENQCVDYSGVILLLFPIAFLAPFIILAIVLKLMD